MYYSGNHYQRMVLDTVYRDGETYFQYLNKITDLAEFNVCYEQLQTTIVKTHTLALGETLRFLHC